MHDRAPPRSGRGRPRAYPSPGKEQAGRLSTGLATEPQLGILGGPEAEAAAAREPGATPVRLPPNSRPRNSRDSKTEAGRSVTRSVVP